MVVLEAVVRAEEGGAASAEDGGVVISAEALLIETEEVHPVRTTIRQLAVNARVYFILRG